MTEMSTTTPTNGQYHHTDLPDAELVSLIERLRLEKNAIILAHNYQGVDRYGADYAFG